MSNESKIKRLKMFLRIWGVAIIVVMSTNWSAFIFKIEAFNPGGPMHLLIWDDIYGHVAPMLFVIYIVWGIYFLIVSKDPANHISFLKFTLWANLAHALVMIPMALSGSDHRLRLFTDIPFIAFISLAIYLWLPDEKIESKSPLKESIS